MGFIVVLTYLEACMCNKNIILIGMPSCGKSTVGPFLAETLGMNFVDTDTLIRDNEKKSPKDIVNQDGLDKFLQIQESLILDLNLSNYVIATGGSVVYSNLSMAHLKKNSKVIYLKLGYEELEQRIEPGRRFAINSGRNLKDIYNERIPLYEKYSDIVISCSGRSVQQILTDIINSIDCSY